MLLTDIRGNWAASWILLVARAGVMEPFANHAFQPNGVVRRSDLAQVVNSLLDKIAEAAPAQPRPWESSRIAFSDLAPGHLAYPAASAAVLSGVMTKGVNDTFQPSAPVGGQEASAAVWRLEAMSRAALAAGAGAR